MSTKKISVWAKVFGLFGTTYGTKYLFDNIERVEKTRAGLERVRRKKRINDHMDSLIDGVLFILGDELVYCLLVVPGDMWLSLLLFRF